MELLKDNELNSYITSILQYPDWREERCNNNAIEFVTKLFQKFQHHSYFHNIGMISTPAAKRHSPRIEDCVTLGSLGGGGVCVHQNFWFVTILQSLGFEAYLAAGSYVSSNPDPEGTHCIGILKLSMDNNYAVDVGCGNPVDGPIPLDKGQLPYTGNAGGFRYQYRYNEDADWYERWQLDGAILGEKFMDETQAQLRYRFTTRPKPYSYFEKVLVDIFTKSATSVFLRNAFLFRALSLDGGGGVGGGGRRFVVVFGTSVALYDEGSREMTKFDCYKSMDNFVVEHFPKLDVGRVREALDYLDKVHTT